MTLALSTPGFSLVAADTRYTFTELGDRDFGHKVRRVPGGWVAASGSVAVVLLALREIEADGLADPARLVHAAREAHEYVGRAAPRGKSHDSFFETVREDPQGFTLRAVLSADGLTVERPHTRTGYRSNLIAWPPGFDIPAAKRANQLHEPALQSSATPEEALRRVAGAFRYGLAIGRGMSAEVEAGISVRTAGGAITPYHLRAPAEWVERASDDEIRGALRTPPTLPPFPLLPAEALAFKPNHPTGVAA